MSQMIRRYMMPGYNHTGPNGLGAMSGKGNGTCRNQTPRNIDGRRHQFRNPIDLTQEKQILENRLKIINQTLNKESN